MKKEIVGVLLILVFAMSFVIAADNTTTNVTYQSSSTTTTAVDTTTSADRAYKCLEDQVGTRTDLSLQDAIFVELALGYKQNADDKIESERSSSAACWPKAGCTLRDTALVGLVYNRLGKDTQEIENWIIARNATLTDLTWYLETDITKHIPASCNIKYDSTERRITIGEDMKLSGDPGICLDIIPSGYWMSIRPSCYNKIFQVSCTEDFISTLLYSKNIGETIYVSSSTHSAASLGTTSEQINAKCLKTGSGCDYEGTLWSTLFLQKTGNEISYYLPYLVALSSDNPQYFPSAFIYIIAGGEDQYNNIVQAQKQSRYWEAPGSRYNRYYDTSLAMLSLYGSSANELEGAKSYLISTQTDKGCWNNNNIRDTAFILYAGWPKDVQGAPGSGGSSTTFPCEPSKSCESLFACSNAGGNEIPGFACSGAKVCCSVKIQQQSCQAQGGIECSSDQECGGRVVSSSDGSCCLDGACTARQIEETCISSYDGVCKSTCTASTESEESGGVCSDGEKVCCVKVTTTSSGISWFWIIILLILIALVVLAIIYRDKLRVVWYKYKSNASSTPVKRQVSPPGPPSPMGRPMPMQQRPFPGMRPMGRPMPPQRTMGKPIKDNDMDETLKKLRDMSK